MLSRKKYAPVFWRPFFDIFLCYLVIAAAIYTSFKAHYFYPIAVFIIANRILALSLLCHESLHGSLFENSFLNNFVGRWFCAFPTFISLSKYRKLHLLHHTTIAHKDCDPDYILYNGFPLRKSPYFKQGVWNLITLKTTRKFLQYYTEIVDFLTTKEGFWTKFKRNKVSGDFREFLLFYTILFCALFYFGAFKYYVLFFLIPLSLITQPYVLLMGGLQHGPIQNAKNPELLSRSIRGPKFLMEILLPLNINFHAEHHLDSKIPHYKLKDFARDLEFSEKRVWKSSYSEALKDLFTN